MCGTNQNHAFLYYDFFLLMYVLFNAILPIKLKVKLKEDSFIVLMFWFTSILLHFTLLKLLVA